MQVRRRARKRLTRAERVPLPRPTAPLERWSMDFTTDTLGDGRGFRTLNIVDDFSHECPAIEVDRSLPGAWVIRVPDRLAETIGLPKVLVCDSGLPLKSRRQCFADLTVAVIEIGEYIETFYNRSRRHSDIGGVSPEQFEAAHKSRKQCVH